MRRVIAAVFVLALTGCAAKVISTTPRQVVVNAGSADTAGALQLAEGECTKQGLHAQLSARPTDSSPRQWVFNCVQ